MKTRSAAFAPCIALCALLGSLAFAADAPATAPAPVTLKGTLECSKCELHETAECGNVLVVKDGDKTVNYYIVDDEAAKAAHGDICMAPKDGVTYTGTVTEKDGKKWMTVTKTQAPK
jgi:hypothetical protein